MVRVGDCDDAGGVPLTENPAFEGGAVTFVVGLLGVSREGDGLDVTPAWGAEAVDGLSRLKIGFKRAFVGGRVSLLQAQAGLSLSGLVLLTDGDSDFACSLSHSLYICEAHHIEN